MKKDYIIKGLIAVSVVCLIAFLVWYGFRSSVFETYELRQKGEAYQTAEYSESSYICCDSDGEGNTSYFHTLRKIVTEHGLDV